jgi:hypothetical protein
MMDVSWNWIIAVLLAASASFISNFGVTLQKLQHMRIAAQIARIHSHNSNTNRTYSNSNSNTTTVDIDSSTTNATATATANGDTHNRVHRDQQHVSGAWHRKPLWRLGLLLIVLGSIADFLALGFG